MVQFNDQGIGNRVADLRAQEEERHVQALAPQQGFEYINLRGYTINPEALSTLSEDESRAAELVVFDSSLQAVSVAAKNPNAPATQAVLQQLQAKRALTVFVCSSSSLEHAWKRYADITTSTAKKKGVFEMSAPDIARLQSQIKVRQDVDRLVTEVSTVNNTRRITQTLEIVFAGALALDASDIHIEPEEAGIRLRYRLDGVLHDVTDLDSYIYKRLMSRLKLLSGMVLNTRVEAQDGRFTFEAGANEIEVRTSVIPGAVGESVVMRLLDPSVASFKIENLDLNPRLLEVVRQELKKPNGMIVTTGPTGSGKTTALYAFLQEVHQEGVKIITIENPVEYKLDGIVQTQTGDDYTFEAGLRAILRQDPDVIMVGEIRDRDVAQTAIHAAQTGHLVFTTLHTNSAVAAFPRLMDLGVDSRVLGSSINIILGQRLLRLLCPHCKEQYIASEQERQVVEAINNTHPQPQPLPPELLLYKNTGCEECGHTGFAGREGIFEAIIMDEAVEEVVLRDPREHIILEAAAPQGIPSMAADGVAKVIAGNTSLNELERVVELPVTSVAAEESIDDTSEIDDNFAAHIV